MKRQHQIVAIAVVIIVAAIIGNIAARTPSPNREQLLKKMVGLQSVQRAPDFALPDTQGTLHALSQWGGKVRLLNFWATWCGPCRKEVPRLIALQKRFASRGFQVIGIATDEPRTQAVDTFAEQYGINYVILMSNNHASSIAHHLGFTLVGLPASVLIDRQANIINVHIGPIDSQATAKRITKLLQKPQKNEQ